MLAGELDEQVGEDLDLDVVEVGGRVLEERLALLGREQRLLLAHRLVDDPDDDPVEYLRGAPDDVQMTVGDRVVAARADRDRGCSFAHPWIRIKVSP